MVVSYVPTLLHVSFLVFLIYADGQHAVVAASEAYSLREAAYRMFLDRDAPETIEVANELADLVAAKAGTHGVNATPLEVECIISTLRGRLPADYAISRFPTGSSARKNLLELATKEIELLFTLYQPTLVPSREQYDKLRKESDTFAKTIRDFLSSNEFSSLEHVKDNDLDTLLAGYSAMREARIKDVLSPTFKHSLSPSDTQRVHNAMKDEMRVALQRHHLVAKKSPTLRYVSSVLTSRALAAEGTIRSLLERDERLDPKKNPDLPPLSESIAALQHKVSEARASLVKENFEKVSKDFDARIAADRIELHKQEQRVKERDKQFYETVTNDLAKSRAEIEKTTFPQTRRLVTEESEHSHWVLVLNVAVVLILLSAVVYRRMSGRTAAIVVFILAGACSRLSAQDAPMAVINEESSIDTYLAIKLATLHDCYEHTPRFCDKWPRVVQSITSRMRATGDTKTMSEDLTNKKIFEVSRWIDQCDAYLRSDVLFTDTSTVEEIIYQVLTDLVDLLGRSHANVSDALLRRVCHDLLATQCYQLLDPISCGMHDVARLNTAREQASISQEVRRFAATHLNKVESRRGTSITGSDELLHVARLRMLAEWTLNEIIRRQIVAPGVESAQIHEIAYGVGSHNVAVQQQPTRYLSPDQIRDLAVKERMDLLIFSLTVPFASDVEDSSFTSKD